MDYLAHVFATLGLLLVQAPPSQEETVKQPISVEDNADGSLNQPASTVPLVPIEANSENETKDEISPWAVGGFADIQYIINSNFPDNHIMRGTPAIPRTGEFNPNLVVAYIRRDPIKSPWMLELALQIGPGAEALYYGEPVAGGMNGRYAGVEVFKHISRANVGVKLKPGTEIAAGVMVAPTQFGNPWPKENWHVSFTWGYCSVPFYLMGARVYQPIGDKVGIGFWLVNSYGLIGDGNKAPSGLMNLVFMPVKNLTLVENVYAGPEDASLKPEAWRLLVDSQIIYNTDKWGIAAVGDYGREKLTFKAKSPVAQWANVMMSVRWHVLEHKEFKWGMAVRPEFFWDHGGRMFNSPDLDNWLISGTFTNDFRFFDALLFRLEYRYDHSTAPSGFFYRRDAITDTSLGLAHNQHSVIFNLVGYFERRLSNLRG